MERLLRSTESTVPRMSYRLLLLVPKMSPSPPPDEQAAAISRANAAAAKTFVVLIVGFLHSFLSRKRALNASPSWPVASCKHSRSRNAQLVMRNLPLGPRERERVPRRGG